MFTVNPMTRNILIWVAIVASMFAISHLISPSMENHSRTGMDQATFNRFVEKSQVIDYSEFLKLVENDQIADITFSAPAFVHSPILLYMKDSRYLSTVSIEHEGLAKRLSEKGVQFRALYPENTKSIGQMIMQGLNLLFFIPPLVFGYMMYRGFQNGGNKTMGFGKSRARLLTQNQNKVTFADVAGIDEAKAELEEIVDFLKDPKKFQRLGGRIPKGVLLIGPPGTGKTLLAKAISGEADVPFFSISGSDFVEMFVGVGASRVRDMFEEAKKKSPCIIFIDEIDAVGGKRGNNFSGGNDEREQTLNQLLVEMDGFEENQNIIVVAATNRPDILDPALLRPGRFDRQVTVSNPDLTGREQILKVHMKKIPLSPNVDPKVIARGTPGFSGADLANLVNEAALMAARKNKLAVGKMEFDLAKDKIMMGTERRGLVMTEAEMKLTAYHEGGHAIVSFYLPDSDPIHKATIIPRGRALGMVMHLPEGDRVSESRDKLLTSIKVSMGGRIAEELIFGDGKVTTGAMSDIKAATFYATHMVTEAGLAEGLGFRNYSSQQQGFSSERPYSEDMARRIDDKINTLLDTCYRETKELMTEKLDKLHILAKTLLQRETLSGDEIKIILEGGELPPLPEVYDDSPRTSVPVI